MHTLLVLNPSAVTSWEVKSDGKGFEAKPCFQNSANKWAKGDAARYCEGGWEGGVPGWQRAALVVGG